MCSVDASRESMHNGFGPLAARARRKLEDYANRAVRFSAVIGRPVKIARLIKDQSRCRKIAIAGTAGEDVKNAFAITAIPVRDQFENNPATSYAKATKSGRPVTVAGLI